MFIKLASLFGVSGDGLIYAARLTSVLFGLVSVYCVGKIAETIAQYKRVRGVKLFGLGAMALLAVWPQFAYLSAYVNNDIIAFAGVAIITFAVLKGVLMGWNRRAALLLGAGATVCILGYTNAYGFVLMGGIVFLISAFLLRKVQKGYRLKLLASVALLPLIIAATPPSAHPVSIQIAQQMRIERVAEMAEISASRQSACSAMARCRSFARTGAGT